jgi:hypothetical protein
VKDIKYLIKDIYDVVGSDWLTKAEETGFAENLGSRLREVSRSKNEAPRLRLSQMGNKCPCQLWHSIHSPELAEPLKPWTHIKFAYGHMVEALVISMAKAAGHEVVGEQDELVVDGVVGHRDCVIDGYVVDVKSAGRLTFQKYKDGSLRSNDPFGYLDQLDAYMLGSRNDDLVRHKSTGFILAVNQELGHLALHEHQCRPEHIIKRIADYRAIVGQAVPPPCTCVSVADGSSGNFKLDIRGSYNPFKYACKPGLRCFLYADGPRYLTKVVRKPDVPEVNREGNIIYAN